MQFKFLNTVSVFVMVSLLLMGCNSSTYINPRSKSDHASSKKPVTINLYTYGSEQDYKWKNTIAAFEKKYPKMNVVVHVLSDKGNTQEAKKRLDLAESSGESMDVIMFSDPAGYSQYVSLGMVAPLNNYIKQDGYNFNNEYKINTAINGTYYALPGKFNPWYVILNKDDLDQAGLPVPTDWTWDDFREYAKRLTTKDHFGAYFHGPQNGSWMEYLQLCLQSEPANTSLLKDDGTSNLLNPLFKKTLELRVAMEKKDKSVTPFTDIMEHKLDYRSQFFNHKTSMLLTGSWMNTMLGGTASFPLNFHIAIAPYPKNNQSDPGGYTPITTDYVSLASNSTHKKEAYTFIRWYTTEGQVVQGMNVPAWKGASNNDLSKIVDKILSRTDHPELVNKQSLITVLKNSKSSHIGPTVSYLPEVQKAVSDEYEKLIFGQQTVDQTVEAAENDVEQIIAQNKK